MKVELQHDRELVQILAATAEGNARRHRAAMERSDEPRGAGRWSQHEMLAASGFVVAASYWSLIDARRAVAAYRTAAQTYRVIGHDYWVVAALAGGDREHVTRIGRSEERHEFPPQMVAFGMLAQAAMRPDDGRTMETLHRAHLHFGNVPIGRLRIPLDVYAECADALRDDDMGDMAEGMTEYIGRASEVMQAASHDTFHWRSLRTAVLPAEPEAVAAIACFAVAAKKRQIPLHHLAGDLDPHGARLLAVAVNLSEEWDEPMRSRVT